MSKETIFNFIEEVEKKHPNKTLTEILSEVCGVEFPYFTDEEVEIRLKEYCLQLM